MFTIILILILAYLIGSIPSGLIIGKTFYNTDIREHGSKNLGGTNTFRTLGIKAGLIVTSMDILKGTLATLLPVIFGADNLHPLIPGVIAVIGHMYPIFARFKGGKAVATSGGILLGFAPLLFAIVLAVFFLSLYVTKYVSLSSMITSLFAIIYVLAFQIEQWGLLIVVTVLFIFICYRHRANIKRIMNKTEPKIKWL